MKLVHVLDLILCTLLVIAGAGSVVVAMRMHGVESRRLQHERDAVARLQEDLVAAEMILEPLRAVLASTQQESAALDRKIPPRGRIGEFLGALEERVHRHGVTLQGVAPEPALREHPYARVPVRLQLAGSFEAVYGFLCDLEGMDRVMEMAALHIAARGDDACQVALTTCLFER